MKSLFRFLLASPQGPAAILFIQLPVGLIFFTQGIPKYIDHKTGIDGFARIGFPHPYFTAHFVGAFNIVCGLLVLLGLWTRAAAVPLSSSLPPRLSLQKFLRYFAPTRPDGTW